MNALCVLLFFSVSCYAATSEEVDTTAKITYTLWINDDIDHIYNMKLNAPVNTTFHKVMDIAAKKNVHYEFTTIEYPFGHYIDEIGGIHEDKDKDIYWFIYITPHLPNKNNPPTDDLLSQWGVDKIYIQDGGHYLFWYKTWFH